MSMYFAGHSGYPNGWYDNGPFGIWSHPSGAEIVGTVPGYVLSLADGSTKEFADLQTAMESI